MSNTDEPVHVPENLRGTPDGNAGDGRASGQTLLVRSAFGWEVLKSTLSAVASVLRSRRSVQVQAQAAAGLPIEQTGRAADLTRERVSHPGWGALLATCAFVVGLASGIGFLFVYWYFDKVHWDPGHNMMLAGSLAVFFLGLGIGLVVHARWLVPHKLAVEPRRILPSPPEEREAASTAYFTGEHEVQRRGLLVGVGLTALGIFAAMIISAMRSLATPAFPYLFSTIWKRGQRLVTIDNKPISVNSLQPGSTTVVFPENKVGSEHAQTVLIRVPEQFLQLPPERANWAPMGYVAYSRVCTHAGCPVGMFEATTDLLMCPCHQSTFDVLRGAQPTGGPADRALPQLPLYVDGDGNLRAGGGFSEPPGPGFWGLGVWS